MIQPSIETGQSLETPSLCSTQRRLWTLLRKHGVELRNVFQCDFGEPLEVNRLRAAMSSVMRRYDVLQSYYPPKVDEPLIASPTIDYSYEPTIELVEAALLGPEELESVRATLSSEPACLHERPYAKFVAARLGDRHFRLIGAIPAMNADGRSVRTLLADLEETYCHGRSEPDHPGAPRFNKVSAWLDARSAVGPERVCGRDLALVPWHLELPIEKKPNRAAGFQNAGLAWELPDCVLQNLSGNGEAAEDWLRTRLVSVAIAWLAQVCAVRTVYVGVLLDGRFCEELLHAVGPYESESPLVADLTETMGFTELSAMVERGLDDLRELQECFSLDSVELPGGRLTAYPLCVDVRRSNYHANGGGRPFTTAKILSAADTYDLKLDCEIANGIVSAQICYNAAVYAPESVRRVQEQLNAVLVATHECPSVGVLTLNFPIPKERVEITATQAESNDLVTLPCLFTHQVADSPDAVAVIEGDRHISYACLNALANRLAHQLIAVARVGPESVVAVRMPMSVDVPLAILGVLKAGAAYVPVDPSWPEERTTTVLRDCGATAILTTGEETYDGCPRIACHSAELFASTEWSTENPDMHVLAENLAYVLYTSGTSGVPKGAMITHRGLTNYITWCASAYEVAASRGAVVHSPLTFDFTETCLLAPLVVGRGVYIVSSDHPLEGLADTLSRLDEVSLIKITPSSIDALRRLLLNRETVCSVRRIVVGGEALLGSRALWSLASMCNAAVVNEYGPTECTVGSIVHEMPRDESIEGPIPIGKPVANTFIRVLKSNGRPAEDWVPGEVQIGGWGVARGYLCRPALTAAFFVPDANAKQAGERVYKTGDLVRQLSTNNLVYLSRRDSQVKIRGHRVELAEVERALLRHPAVAECVVTLAERPEFHSQMVAFVVPNASDGLTTTDLRNHLAAILPAYMIPGSVRLVTTLPMTVNGKLDVAALNEALCKGEMLRLPMQVPETDLERLLHRLWQGVLNTDDIGIDDNFFELGGDSILSIQLLARAHEAGLRLRPQDLTAHPTIRTLAVLARVAPPAMPQPDNSEGDVPLTPIQRWFFDQNLEEFWHYNQSVLLTCSFPWTANHFEKAAAALAEQHDALRLCFEKAGASWRQFYGTKRQRSVVTELDCSGLSETEWQERLRAIARETQRSISIDVAPLLRFTLCSRGEDGGTFVYIVAHHLVIDHFSWPILLNDLQSALEQVAAGRPIKLSPKTGAYLAWAESLIRQARGSDLIEESAYWRGDRWTKVPFMPADYADGSQHNRAEDEDSVLVVLDRSDTDTLIRRTRGAYNTEIVDLLLTAYAIAYARWSGTSVLTIDLEAHGRDADDGPNVSRTVGWFTNLFPVYIGLSNITDIGAAIRQVKESLRAVPRGGIGYGLLRYMREPDGIPVSVGECHTSEVAFNYLGDVDRIVSPGQLLTWVPLSPAANRSGKNRRPHVLEIGAYISKGELRVTFTYGRRIHLRSTIAALAESFTEHLKTIVNHCSTQRAKKHTPSEFPLAHLTQDTLDAIVAANPNVEDIYPLSDAQKGILFHATRSSTERAYVVQLQIELSGHLDEVRFEQCWQTVVARHTTLRTSFLWESIPEPLQIVHRHTVSSFVRMDWRSEDIDRLEVRFKTWLANERATGIDLTKVPLHRLSLFLIGDHRYRLVWMYHHALLDGWSTSNVLREVLSLYAKATGKATTPLPAAEPYRDYIAWLAKKSWEESRAYWQRAMADVTAGTALAVPRGKAPENKSSRAFDEEALPLEPADVDALVALSRRLQITLNVVVQGAWAIVLSRYARTDDVIFGVTVSGRPYELAGVEHRVGLFLNTVPMRVRINRSATIAEYLRKVNSDLHEMLQHEHAPLVEVQRICHLPERETIFESIVVFENFPKVDSLGVLEGELAVESVLSVEQTNYPMTIVASANERDLSIKAVYDPGYFSAVVAKQMVAHFSQTLRSMAGESDERVGNLPVCLSRTTTKEVISSVQQPEWAEPLHRIFETQVARAPDAIAAVDGYRAISYDALNRRANQLAHHLVSISVEPGTYVAVCLERSVEMIIAILATLKAGAAYVPIDCRFPAKRIETMAAHARFAVVDGAHRDAFLSTDIRVVDVEQAARVVARQSERDLTEVLTTPEDVAYLMYTSGSSGEPKGTLVTHHNTSRLFGSAFQLYSSLKGGVWSFFHSIAFDFSVWEIFGALLTGGRLVVTPYWTARSPDRFAELIRREGINVLSQTPSAFQELLSVGGLISSSDRFDLKWVVFGGEALHLTPLLNYCEELDRRGVRLLNMYGITETTVHVTHRLMDDCQQLEGRSYIGKALPDLRIYLVDQYLTPVPDQVAGEICVAGEGVTLGYMGRARLTAERFVPSPFSGDVGGRLYRSGDLGRNAGDSDMEYLGRGDRQVKVRGFRVELDEIRLHILRQPAVRDALVRVEENRTGNRALVAYIVPASSEFSIASLRAGLREHVPDYMIPAFIRALARFPLTPNGKVDYAALSSNVGTDERSSQGFVPPHTWEQESIADVWRDVLGVQEVGIYDSFFALGGDSIKALRAVAQLRSLGFEASIEALFEHPTVAELSRLVSSSTRPPENMSVRDDGDDASELQTTERLPDGVIDTYPTTQLQLAMFFHGADSGEEAALYHNVSLVRVGGVFDETRFRQAVDNLVAKHPSLRTAFALEGFDMPIQMVYASVKVPITIARLEGLFPSDQRIQIEGWFEREKRRGFALDIAPLIRFHIAVCSDRIFYLGVTEHHAILDGWSVASLLTELFEGYVGYSLDQPQSWSYCPEANACRQYALLERKAIASNAHQTFWKEYLEGYSPLQLPVRLSDGGAEFERSQVKKERVTLDDALTGRLRSLARESQVPLKTVLLAAHLNVLGFIANSPDTITGLITHGRPEMDSGEAAGLFLNTLPLRIKQTAATWNQWIRRVFDEERRLLPYRRYPLQAMRDQFDRPPSLNTAFNYTNFHVYERLQAAAAIQILDIQVHEATNFDLLVDFTVMSRTGKLDLTLSYNTTSFGFGQIEGVIRSYVECLEAMTALEPTTAKMVLARHTSEQDIEPISVSSPLDPGWTCLRELIATASQPAWSDRIALVDGHRHVSYGELWTQVRGLELRWRTSGLATESAVAVLMDKSIECVTAMLTVMVAGWAFVPLDGTDPAERINYILKNTNASIIITDASNALALPESGRAVILLDRLAASQSWRNDASGLPTVSPDNLAYILYTSGTTGRPKGVAMHHGGIANLMKWQCHAMPVENQRVLHYAPIGFDVSVQEVLTALCGQSTLVVVPAGMRRDFVNLAHLACEQQIECIFAPDTVIRALLLASEGCGIQLPALRMIVNAGEPLTIERELAEFMRSGGTVYNHYGPTESHVVTAAQIEDSAAMEDPRAPIGRAIDRTRILILDWCSRPVLPGTVGEIYIEGPNVARGYHRAPGLTAERFVPNPLPGPQPGARVFRTGDLGYRDNRGTIWFWGRADAQVKVRGYRIEMEEIRHALLRHPGVADAAVTTTGDRDEKSLCAYIVPQHNVDTDNVREFARTLLPVYMVPSLVQTVSSIPTTRNGKVDYATLAAMASPVRTPVSISKPNGPIQTELLAMWRDIVKNNVEIGPDVDFLQIGGNSILLLQLQLKLRARFGVSVSMGRLALNSSFLGMCCCIRDALDKQGSTGCDAKRGKAQTEALSTLTKVATPMSD